MATIDNQLDPSATGSFSIAEILQRLEGPLETVRGMPNEVFTSAAFHALECEKLFTRTWVFAGRLSSVPNPGDRKPIDVAGHPLFIVRDHDGVARAFHNVCPHRGARIVPVSSQAGNIVCPYHAWTFDLGGRLRARPHYYGPGQADTQGVDGGDAPCLHEVRTASWADWLFVNLDGNAPRFEEYIKSFLSGWADFSMADIRFAHHLSVDYNCNWKLAIENYSDFYHVFRVHPALDVSLGDRQRTAMVCDGAVMHNQTRTDDTHATISMLENAPRLPDMGGVVADGLRKTVFGVVFPNMAVNIEHSDVQLSYFEPLGATRTRLHRSFYFRGDAAADPQFQEVRQCIYDDWERVLREDEEACRLVQEGRQSSAYDGGRLAPVWDAGTRHFHRLVMRAVSDDVPVVA